MAITRFSLAALSCLALHAACRKTSGTASDAAAVAGSALGQGAPGPNGTEPEATAPAGANANVPTAASNPNQAVLNSSAKVPQGFVYSPYKDIIISANWNTRIISTAVSGKQEPLLASLGDVNVVTWSFATGACGSETWGAVVPDALVQANVAA